MKFSREGHKIILEVEPADCSPGHDLEMTADLFLQCMKLGYRNPEIEAAVLNTHTMFRERDRLMEDFNERWEIL